jgi:hypothetical protein
VLFGGVDEHSQVVQQRPLGVSRIARVELDMGPADLDTRIAFVARVGRCEPQLLVLARGTLRVVCVERNMVEVVLDVGRRLDEPNPHSLAELDLLRGSVGELGPCAF